MANLPEKNITTVDKVTSIPSNANLYINANGEFRQATVDDVLKASPVIADSIANQYKNTSGSPILLTDSTKGVAIDFDVYGRSTQTQYSGKNKLNCSGLSATTSNGVTFTPVYDDKGSLLYVNVNGTATADTTYKLSPYETVEDNTYILSGAISSPVIKLAVGINNGASGLATDVGSGVTFTFNAEEHINMGATLYVYNRYTYNNVKVYPMIRLASVTDSTYEPYVGNQPSPSPDYKQTPKSVGDSGWFDGELLQGYYDHTTGKQTTNTTYVCSKNPIPCNPSDNVVLQHKETVSRLSIVFYDKNMKHISFAYIDNADTFTTTIPTNAHYFHFNIGYGSSITPQTAKHICVTINDKYALIVDSVGKNFLNSLNTEYSAYGGTVTPNSDGTYLVKGTTTQGISFNVGEATLPIGEYIMSGFITDRVNVGYLYFALNGENIISSYKPTTFTVTEEITVTIKCALTANTTYSDVLSPMIRLASVTDATYEPYIKSRKYIPISAPLRGIGEVTDVASLSECEVDRKFTKKVLNGSEGWSLKTIGCELYLNNTNSGNALCTHYKKNNGVSWGDLQDNEFNIIGTVLRIKDNTHQSTLDEWKTWLSANPITVIYELAEPTTESIEPTEIVTYEGVTHISVSDDADMEVEYPTSKVAGIASIGWSKGRRAEYDLEQLKAQMLALQTTIVSTV